MDSDTNKENTMNALIQDNLVRNFVAGEWQEGDNEESIAVKDPATGEVITYCALASDKSLSQALLGARQSFESGVISNMEPANRAKLLANIAIEIRKLVNEGGELLCRESGKTLNDAKAEFIEAANYFDYYGGLADKIEGKSIPLGPDYIDYTVYEPYGISAQIVPWNFPVSLAARSLAPALAAGNSVIIKSPELDPLALASLGLAIERAGVPKGVVSILNGVGTDLGAKLVASKDIDQIVFTGSVATGQAILKSAANEVVPALMELGGKSAGIVYEDADLEEVLESVKWGIFFNAGQVCSAMSRLLVCRERYDEVLERCVKLAESLTIDHGLKNPDLTAIISANQLEDIERKITQAKNEGVDVATGGSRIERTGHFMAPTILSNVNPNSRIAQEEIFGPVLCLIPFTSNEEAIEIANSTEFGLVAGVFTKDLSLAHKTASALKAGQVFVNEWYAGGMATPFGGIGKSGFGREKGVEALYNYVRTKNIAIKL
jgi:aldehyde dehydrogenase (NAD+)